MLVMARTTGLKKTSTCTYSPALPNSYVSLVSKPRSASLGKLVHVIKSLVPLLLFLTVYMLNKVLHILPLLADLGCVHIYTIRSIERFFLGCNPHRILSSFHNPLLDVLSAIPYLLHYPIPLVFPAYLLYKGESENLTKFYWLLGWVMWVHYVVWLIFPHTPPWVIDNIQMHNMTSLGSISMKHREGCAFARLDKLTGLPFFYNMFAGNPIPYASFPSGHVAWPAVIYVIGGPGGNHFALYVGWVIWATLYSCHHYVLDTLGAMLVVFLTHKVLSFLSSRQLCTSNYKCKPVVACPFHV